MQPQKPFKKLSEVQNLQPTKVIKVFYQAWIDNKPQRSETPQKGYSKVYLIEFPEYVMSMSNSQFNQMLGASYDQQTQTADFKGKTFSVDTNNKQGMEIRYFINLVEQEATLSTEEANKVIDNIPW